MHFKHSVKRFGWLALAVVLLQCPHAQTFISGAAASTVTSKASLEHHEWTAKAKIHNVLPTRLGDVQLIDTNSDGIPDTAVLNGEVLIPPRKASNGGYYGLQEVSFDGEKGRGLGKMVRSRSVFSQSFGNCQHIFLDFSGPKVRVSQRFPDEKQFPRWVGEDSASACFEMIGWNGRSPFLFLL